MRQTIFYWSPCLNPVGTVKSTLNSISAMNQYGKNNFDTTLINACGEWDDYLNFFEEKNIKVVNFKYKFYNYLPKEGYLKSRLSYILIFIFCFVPLTKILLKDKPNFLIAHLITSLPLVIMNLFKLNTKIILRISGMPKLNFFRRNFWKNSSKKIHLVTCPTLELKSKLINLNLFKSEKLYFLPDAIIDLHKYCKDVKKEASELDIFEHKRIIFAAGRLTKQKNFLYLIDEFKNFSEENNEFILLILGDGEEKKQLNNFIKQKKLQNKVYLLGHVDNVYKYFKKGEVFVLSSLWEEVGFVMVEAALSNLFIISSNCPNGPSEFLNNGEDGILFNNNKKGELTESFKKYLTIDDLKTHKVKIKKNTMKYSKFRHFLKLEKILK